MRNMIRRMSLLIVVLLAAAFTAALAEDAWNPDEEYSFADIIGMDIITYNDVPWNFPVDMMEMEPDLVLLVNKEMFLSKDYVPEDLVTMKSLKLDSEGNNTNGGVRRTNSGMELRRECAEALAKLCDAARAEGHELYLKSAYRSYRTQDTMYYNRLKQNGYDDGWVTKPGASDHQTGLGCDVVPKNWTDRGMNENMAKEEETQWMAEHCAEFGFILRYLEGKTDITGYSYEPWHIRYVGVTAAADIHEKGVTLEEYLEELAL